MAGTGSYTAANARAKLALAENDLSPAAVLATLRLLPMPRNTQRLGVFPPGAAFVLSANAGLTTTRGERKTGGGKLTPCLSSLVRKCPAVVELLARFCPATGYTGPRDDDEPVVPLLASRQEQSRPFYFTSITVNKNYAAFPHRDANHFDGKARIVALGDFTGGELWFEEGAVGDEGRPAPSIKDVVPAAGTTSLVEGAVSAGTLGSSGVVSAGSAAAELNGVRGKMRDIKNKWCDFDARRLHGTMPFEGERFSLVYFSHEAFLRVAAPPEQSAAWSAPAAHRAEDSPRAVLERLGVRWPPMVSKRSSSDVEVVQHGSPGAAVGRAPSGQGGSGVISSPWCLRPRSSPRTSSADGGTTFLVSPLSNTNLSTFASLECCSVGAVLKCRCDDWRPLSDEGRPVRIRVLTEPDRWGNGGTGAKLARAFADRARGTVQVWRLVAESACCSSGEQRIESLLSSIEAVCGNNAPAKEAEAASSGGRAPFVGIIKTAREQQMSTKKKNQLLAAVCGKLGIVRGGGEDPKSQEQEAGHRKKLGVLAEDSKISVWELVESESEDRTQAPQTDGRWSPQAGRSITTTPQAGRSVVRQQPDGVVSQTALPPQLARVLANLAKVGPGCVALDPFAGEGSLLQACAALGAACVGTEIRDVVHPGGHDEHVRANVFHCPVRPGSVDAVVTDPPFGRREAVFNEKNENLYFAARAASGGEKSSSCRTAVGIGISDRGGGGALSDRGGGGGNNSEEDSGEDSSPLEQQTKRPFSITRPLSPLSNPALKQLFLISMKVLSPKGRLVFTYPAYPNAGPEEKLDICDADMARFGNALVEEEEQQGGRDQGVDLSKWRWHLVGSADQSWVKQSGHCMRRRVIVLEKQRKRGKV